MYDLAVRLAPIPRSLTGNGVRETLRLLGDLIPLEVEEVPSGSRVLDWIVPPEWNVREAWIDGPRGRIVDFADSPLHLVGYSTPVRATLTREELLPHLHSLPEHPDWIPYRTSYYDEAWGFCLPQRVVESLEDGTYEVCIDSTLDAGGSLSYGECVLAGRTEEEFLVSTHVCHPAMANDNLSGIGAAVALARAVMAREERRFTYRFLFVPGTLGSIAWLAGHRDVVPRIRHGLVLSGVGNRAPLRYKRSRRGGAEIDRAVECVLRDVDPGHGIEDFSPYGYDERQYGSPGFDLPVGCLMRSRWGSYPEYHTSADDLGFIDAERLGETFEALALVVDVLEGNGTYVNQEPYGEPQLGRRGLFRAVGGSAPPGRTMALLWVLNLSDGTHSLLDIAVRAGLPFSTIRAAAQDLERAGLLREQAPPR